MRGEPRETVMAARASLCIAGAVALTHDSSPGDSRAKQAMALSTVDVMCCVRVWQRPVASRLMAADRAAYVRFGICLLPQGC